jgi:hypothetical protein
VLCRWHGRWRQKRDGGLFNRKVLERQLKPKFTFGDGHYLISGPVVGDCFHIVSSTNRRDTLRLLGGIAPQIASNAKNPARKSRFVRVKRGSITPDPRQRLLRNLICGRWINPAANHPCFYTRCKILEKLSESRVVLPSRNSLYLHVMVNLGKRHFAHIVT